MEARMPRIVHFEIGADVPNRAIEFYKKVFGWKFQKWDGPMDYWMVMTGDGDYGIDGGLAPRHPDSIFANTIDVDDIDAYVKMIVEEGGEIIYPKSSIPGVGYLAYFKDTEGNVLGIMQEDMSA